MSYLSYVQSLLQDFPQLQVVVASSNDDRLVNVNIVDTSAFLEPKVRATLRDVQSLEVSNAIDFPQEGLRVFLIEDLSMSVIETFGKKFNLDPAFFADHLRYSLYPSDLQVLLDRITGRSYQFSSSNYHDKPYFSLRWHRLGAKGGTASHGYSPFPPNIARASQDLFVSGGPDGFSEDFRARTGTKNRNMVAPNETISVYKARQGGSSIMIVLFDPLPLPVEISARSTFQSIALVNSAISTKRPPTYSDFQTASKTSAPHAVRSRDRIEQSVLACRDRVHAGPKLVNAIFGMVLADWQDVLSQRAPLFDLIDVLKVDNDIVQERVTQWRRILGFWSRDLGHDVGSVADALATLRVQSQKKGVLETHDEVDRASLPIESFARLEKAVENLKRRNDETSNSLMASMSIIESQKAILQTEEISRITELAFFFIPISFVASIYGTNITDFNNKLTLESWGFVTLGILASTYLVRLAAHIQSKHLKRSPSTHGPSIANAQTHTPIYAKRIAWSLIALLGVVVIAATLVPPILITNHDLATAVPSATTVTTSTTISTTQSTSSSARSTSLTTTRTSLTSATSAATITPSSTPPSRRSGENLAAIVGGAVGGVAFLVIIGFVLFTCRRRRKSASLDAPMATAVPPEYPLGPHAIDQGMAQQHYAPSPPGPGPINQEDFISHYHASSPFA